MSNTIAIQIDTTFTPEQLNLIRDTVAKKASPEELRLFVYRAKSMGLDPLKPGQVHFVKYGDSPGSIIVGIEGFRSIAHRTGKLSGIKRGAIRDESGKLTGAWAEVFRTDWTHPAREEVPLSEYAGSSPIWRKMPETMIKKVAECAALRMAFPNDLGGVYEQAELSRTEEDPPSNIIPAADGQPIDGVDGLHNNDYHIPYTPWVKMTIAQAYNRSGEEKLLDAVDSLKDQMAGRVKSRRDFLDPEVKAKAETFINEVESFIRAISEVTNEV